MIEVQAEARPTHKLGQCSICGKSIRINPLQCTDAEVVCRTCRCTHCSIPISTKPCRCGTAHGTPSRTPGLCERCFVATVPTAPAAFIDDDVAVEFLILPALEEQFARQHASIA